LLTHLPYPEIQKLIDRKKLKAIDLICDGVGCKFAEGNLELITDRDINCAHFERLKKTDRRTLYWRGDAISPSWLRRHKK
jgi:hypothetical protein